MYWTLLTPTYLAQLMAGLPGRMGPDRCLIRFRLLPLGRTLCPEMMSRVVLVVAVGSLPPGMDQWSIVRLAVVVAEIPAVVVAVVAVPVNFVWLIVDALILFSVRSGEILARGTSPNGHRIVCKCPVLLYLSIGLSVVWFLRTGLRLRDCLWF